MNADVRFGLSLMLYGMGLVFLILALLWVVITLFQRIDRALRPAAAPETAPESPTPPESRPQPAELAAMAAAIHRFRQEQAQPPAPPLTAPPPRGSSERWLLAGRARQLRPYMPSRRRSHS